MINIRKYGQKPYKIVVVHGGPGAPGDLADLAIELSNDFGVLEPMQTKSSIKDLIVELKSQVEENSNHPVILIGHSWGAFLSLIFASEYPNLLSKLILISCPPLEEQYAQEVKQTRLSRLSKTDLNRLQEIENNLKEIQQDKVIQELMSELIEIIAKCDGYSLIPRTNRYLLYQDKQHKMIWDEAKELRKSGKLLNIAKLINCPVVGIHGDYDPHPFAGVETPLKQIARNSKFILLKNCGHYPWYEKEAKDSFYKLLKQEIV